MREKITSRMYGNLIFVQISINESNSQMIKDPSFESESDIYLNDLFSIISDNYRYGVRKRKSKNKSIRAPDTIGWGKGETKPYLYLRKNIPLR